MEETSDQLPSTMDQTLLLSIHTQLGHGVRFTCFVLPGALAPPPWLFSDIFHFKKPYTHITPTVVFSGGSLAMSTSTCCRTAAASSSGLAALAVANDPIISWSGGGGWGVKGDWGGVAAMAVSLVGLGRVGVRVGGMRAGLAAPATANDPNIS